MVDEALGSSSLAGGHQQPALIEMNFRHDGFNKGTRSVRPSGR